MDLVTLRLCKYRSHSDTLIDFREFNIAVFMGDNGSGKSSIAGALKWVIFDDADPIDVLMIGEDEGFVKLIFDESGSRYMIKRTLRRNGEKVKSKLVLKAKVNTNWEDYTDRGIGSKTNVQNKILDIIKADKEIFSHTSFVEEGEIDSLMKLKPQDRRDVFSRPEGLLIYESGLKNVKKKLSESNLEYKLVSEKVLDFKIGYRDKFDQDSNSVEKLSNKLYEKRKELEKVKSKIEEIEKTKKNLSESDSAKRQIEILQGAINKAKERYIGLEEENDDLLTKGKEAEDKLPELNKKIEKKNKDGLISERTQINSDMNGIKDSIESLRLEILDLKSRLKKVRKTCDECGNELNDDQYEDAKRKLKRKIEIKEVELEDKFEEKQKLSVELEDVEEKYKKIRDLIKEQSDLQQIVERYTNVYVKHEESKMQYESVKLENNEKIAELKKKVIAGKDSDDYEDTKDDYNQISREVAVLEEKISTIKKLEIKKQDEMTKFKDLVKKKIQVKKERQALLLSKQGFIDIPELIIDEAIPELEEQSNEILSQFDKSDLKLKIVTEDEKGNSTFDWIVTNEGKIMKYGQLSQGEKMRVSFAFRIGNGIRCSHTRGCDLNFLIIDEIHALDAKGLQEFSEIIRSLSKLFKNIIIISHLTEITQYFSTQFKFQKDKKKLTKARFIKNGEEMMM